MIARLPSHLTRSLALAAAFLLTACAGTTLVGTEPAQTPPRLVQLEAKDALGKPLITWDRPFAFGPVPAQLQNIADQACMRSRIDLMGLGYHPKAEGIDGKPLPQGGFFCAPKPQGDRPDFRPPRLVRVNGELGWDRPVAFGRIPTEAMARGKALCASVAEGLIPIGHHPQALNEAGEPIAGGGFFCAAP